MPGFKDVRGFLWPESDTDCMAVVFDWLADLEIAYRHVRRWDAAVQAGGNTGVWPKAMGRRFKTIYTFEPEPSNFYCLSHNCPEPNIIKFQAALGYDRRLVGMAYEHGMCNMGAVYVNGGGQIPILRIDDLNLPACDFIQIDVEGYDLEALRGGMATIEKFHPVIMAEDKGLSEKYGTPKGAIGDFLKAFGYELREEVHRDLVFA